MGGLVVVCTEEYQAHKLNRDQTKGHEVHRITFRQYIPLSTCVCRRCAAFSAARWKLFHSCILCLPPLQLPRLLITCTIRVSADVCLWVCWQVCTHTHTQKKNIIVKRSPQNLVDTGKPTVNFGWVMTKRSPFNVAGSLKFKVWNLTQAS